MHQADSSIRMDPIERILKTEPGLRTPEEICLLEAKVEVSPIFPVNETISFGE